MTRHMQTRFGRWLSYALALGLCVYGTQGLSQIWERTFGGSNYDWGYSVRQTSDGGFIVAGATDSFGAGSYDVYLVKTDANGNQLWSKTYGGSGYDRAWSVRQTADGGFIIAGDTTSFGAGDFDMYLIKTDANGNELWSKTFGCSSDSDEDGQSVQQTSDGGFIIAGYTWSFGNSADLYLVKTDASGNTLWTNTFGGTSDELAHAVDQTSDGGFVIAGYTFSFGAGSADAYLVKTDADGNELWSKTYGGTDSDGAYSMQQTADGGFVIAGYTYSFGAGSADVYLVKTDADGNELWSRALGGSAEDIANSVQQTPDGGFVVAGSTSSFGAGANDVYVVKTDAGGNERAHKTFGGSDSDRGWSVQLTAQGGVVVAGFTRVGDYDYDVYLVHYDPASNFTPLVRANGYVGPIVISTGEALEVSLTMDVNPAAPATNADWWVVARTPLGLYSFIVSQGWVPGLHPAHQGPIIPFEDILVLNTDALPAGSYTFYFGVDTVMNGMLDFDQLCFDEVEVEVVP